MPGRERWINALWYAFGIGARHFQMAAASMINGGHARVGFEDNLYLKKNVLVKNNAEMVRKVVEIAALMDREVATPQEARQILKLTGGGEARSRSKRDRWTFYETIIDIAVCDP